ncbi:prepilin-type N-terminal cleavage/methylation domain-containing protein [Vagococcus lutrae]|uniref:competence type IV pilus minor pilin ComGD n=1 Tax=Vagococcus lutrae TaxID=81947 RepID=UPI001C982570|nr:competence type IV pilus minor pilin ComGD [Vagococcus lutrae]MDT2806509.1 competence type IV pilus minor pilin ComGD [Vagococcus lutrae]MDT2817665.1 competence type IV pilus minor pilin ComGD [Vagococcus lutrae]MDT2826128.1 competence type IV pilus minor pilin ComGD [Vagococcus lutrae]QZN87962.1 prepilin-type N-terminal cleavage/methylation domain-containing protein [Vagococcus lutrae]UQF18201.1 prepilin-type N-terminal cleavage/methylation domain-containing protein [Vagococcus lutrae]
MKQHDKFRGFTLLEVLIVLALTLILVGWPIISYQKWMARYHVHDFCAHFETVYKRCQQMAMLTGRPARLKLNRSKRCIETEMVELTGDRVFDSWVVPSEVTMQSNTTIMFNGTTGNLAHPALTVYFYNEIDKQPITYTVNVGSGKLEKKER